MVGVGRPRWDGTACGDVPCEVTPPYPFTEGEGASRAWWVSAVPGGMVRPVAMSLFEVIPSHPLP